MELEFDMYKSLVYGERNVLLQRIEMAAVQGEISKEFLSLAYAVVGKMSQAEDMLILLEKNENLFALEAKMLLTISRHKHLEATALANKILDKYPNAAFARYFLTSNAIREKRFQTALNHCQAFLQYYPKHVNVTLQMSEVLAYLKKYQEAMNCAKQCESSLKQRLYVLLIPSVLPKYRLMFLFLGILAAAVGLHILVLIVVLMILFTGILISLLKDSGTLIPARLLYLGMMMIVSWYFGYWVWSLVH